LGIRVQGSGSRFWTSSLGVWVYRFRVLVYDSRTVAEEMFIKVGFIVQGTSTRKMILPHRVNGLNGYGLWVYDL
jgi:hypothetical protein